MPGDEVVTQPEHEDLRKWESDPADRSGVDGIYKEPKLW